MERYLLPRLSAAQARRRLEEIQDELTRGVRASSLVLFDPKEAVPNATGGQATIPGQLEAWRREVLDRTNGASGNSAKGVALGRALQEVINPIPSDAAHDGIWYFLSLYIFPDVVLQRWPGKESNFISGKIELPVDRWIGAQAGRDRNYLKIAWRSWTMLGSVMEYAEPPLGEDELVGLLERTAVARNQRLLVACAEKIVSIRNVPGGRSEFARAFLKVISYQTGARILDLLNDTEIAELVDQAAAQVRDGTSIAPRANIPMPSPRNSGEMAGSSLVES